MAHIRLAPWFMSTPADKLQFSCVNYYCTCATICKGTCHIDLCHLKQMTKLINQKHTHPHRFVPSNCRTAEAQSSFGTDLSCDIRAEGYFAPNLPWHCFGISCIGRGSDDVCFHTRKSCCRSLRLVRLESDSDVYSCSERIIPGFG